MTHHNFTSRKLGTGQSPLSKYLKYLRNWYEKAKKLHPAVFHAIPIIFVLIFGIYASHTLQQGKELRNKADILMAQKSVRQHLSQKREYKDHEIEKLNAVIEELKASMKRLCPSNSVLVEKECVCKEGYGFTYDKKSCTAIPRNAYYVGSISDTWLCNDGYVEVNGKCVAMEGAIITTDIQRAQSPIIPSKNISKGEKEKHYKEYLKSMSVWMRFLERDQITQQEFENYEKISRNKYEEETGESLSL